MRRIFFRTGTLVLGLGTLMWATAPLSAQRGRGYPGGGYPGGGYPGGGHPAVRVGSVRYGARPPVRYVSPVGAATVRYGHYAGAAPIGAYRNPYRAEYFRHFRPGYRPYVLGGAQYYGYNSLPLGYQPVVLNGITYYLYDGVYYQPYIYGGQTVYMAVPDQ